MVLKCRGPGEVGGSCGLAWDGSLFTGWHQTSPILTKISHIALTKPATPDTERFSPSPHHSSSQNLLETLYVQRNEPRLLDPLQTRKDLT